MQGGSKPTSKNTTITSRGFSIVRKSPTCNARLELRPRASGLLLVTGLEQQQAPAGLGKKSQQD